jgi:hypothetical protein
MYKRGAALITVAGSIKAGIILWGRPGQAPTCPGIALPCIALLCIVPVY